MIAMTEFFCMPALGHVWTPTGQGILLAFCLRSGASHVSGLCLCGLMTAGPDVIRRSGPYHFLALDYSKKSVLTGTSKMTLSVPRDRAATFDPKLIAKYQRRFPDFDDKIISMYARGMTVREIRGHLEELYGIDVSPDLISAVTDAVLDEVTEWQNRWRCLRRRGKRYNKRAGKNAGRGLIPNRIDISERPAIVARKARLGDWEGDTVVSAGHNGGLLTLVERKSKLTKISKLRRSTARATQRATVRRLKPINNFVHTITFDNGKEFAAHQDIAHALKARIFFATPYHAWERGLNENTNGLIRDFFPKGTDFSTISNAEVTKVERLLNARPRKSLDFRSPQEVFDSLACS